jgi:hypothetical protein
LARGPGAAATVLLALSALALMAAGCNRPAPRPSNSPAAVVCAPADAACLSAQARAQEAELERQILARHEAETNLAEANAAAVNGAEVVGPAGPQPPGAPPALVDGAYECSDFQHAMGTVYIKGATFRFLPLGAYSGAFAPYQVDAAGAIQWGGAFAGLNDAPPAMITESKVEPWGFTVTFLASPGAVAQTMICKAPAPKTPHPRSSSPLPSGSVR